MKKEFLLGAIALLISVGVTAQTSEPLQTQTKTKKQLRIEARQQAKVQDQTQSGDQIMTQSQTKAQTKAQTMTQSQVQEQVQSGDPIMTQSQTKTQNHGETVSETAKQAQSGSIVREQAKLKGEAQKSMKKAKTATKNNGSAKSIRTNRPATVKGTGTGRK